MNIAADHAPTVDALERHISAAAEALAASQKSDGHWCFELEADATIPAEYVLLRHFRGESPDLELERLIGAYLRRVQGLNARAIVHQLKREGLLNQRPPNPAGEPASIGPRFRKLRWQRGELTDSVFESQGFFFSNVLSQDARERAIGAGMRMFAP